MIYGRTGLISFISEINVGGYDYFLCWQNGFLEYLRRGYTLNNDIYLFGVIVTYNPWQKKGYIFLRDFSPWSLEEMYEGRLGELR